MLSHPSRSTLFPYTTLFRSINGLGETEPGYLTSVACGISNPTPPDALGNFPDNHIILRSEEHTSELQSRENLVCRLLLEKIILNYYIHIIVQAYLYQITDAM